MWVPFLCMFKICHGMKICHDLWPTDVLFPTHVGKLHRFSLTFFIEWGRRDATGVLSSRLGLPPDSSASNSLKIKAFCSLVWWHDLRHWALWSLNWNRNICFSWCSRLLAFRLNFIPLVLLGLQFTNCRSWDFSDSNLHEPMSCNKSLCLYLPIFVVVI